MFMRIFASSQVSSASTMQTVSLRFLPLIWTVSPRKSESSCIVLRWSDTTLLSSFTASSTIRRLGFFFLSFGSSLHQHQSGNGCRMETPRALRKPKMKHTKIGGVQNLRSLLARAACTPTWNTYCLTKSECLQAQVPCTPLFREPAIDTQRQQTLTRKRGQAPGGSHGFSVTQTCEAGGQKAAVRGTGAASKRALVVCARFLSAFLCGSGFLRWTPWQQSKTLEGRRRSVSVTPYPSQLHIVIRSAVPGAKRTWPGAARREAAAARCAHHLSCGAQAPCRRVLCAHAECFDCKIVVTMISLTCGCDCVWGWAGVGSRSRCQRGEDTIGGLKDLVLLLRLVMSASRTLITMLWNVLRDTDPLPSQLVFQFVVGPSAGP